MPFLTLAALVHRLSEADIQRLFGSSEKFGFQA
jgi:hypothetical protein